MNKPPAAENAPLTPNEYQYCVTHACHFSIKQKVYKKMPNLSDTVWFNLKNLHTSTHDSLTYNGMYGIHVHGFRGERETGNVRPKQVNPAIHHWRVPELGLPL